MIIIYYTFAILFELGFGSLWNLYDYITKRFNLRILLDDEEFETATEKDGALGEFDQSETFQSDINRMPLYRIS